jgi:hypothetical protein
MFQVYISNVSDVLEVCYKYFHMDVVKVNQDVAYVEMVIHYVASVCPRCFICFLTYVATVFI